LSGKQYPPILISFKKSKKHFDNDIFLHYIPSNFEKGLKMMSETAQNQKLAISLLPLLPGLALLRLLLKAAYPSFLGHH